MTTVAEQARTAPADMVAMLSGAPAMAALGADKVFLNAADEGTVAPYVVVSATVDPQYGLDNTMLAATVSFTLAAWGQSGEQAEAVGDAIQDLIDNAAIDLCLLMTGRVGGFDQATTMDVAVLTIDRLL